MKCNNGEIIFIQLLGYLWTWNVIKSPLSRNINVVHWTGLSTSDLYLMTNYFYIIKAGQQERLASHSVDYVNDTK